MNQGGPHCDSGVFRVVRYFTDLRVMVQGGECLMDDAGTFLPDGSPENHALVGDRCIT